MGAVAQEQASRGSNQDRTGKCGKRHDEASESLVDPCAAEEHHRYGKHCRRRYA